MGEISDFHEAGRSDNTLDIKKANDKIRKILDQSLQRENDLRRLGSLQRQTYIKKQPVSRQE